METESNLTASESKRNIEFIPVSFFLYCDYINRFQPEPSLVHNEDDSASQAYRWRVRRLSLQVVYNWRRVPPSQQTLRTRLPGDRCWRHNIFWCSGSLRWVRKVLRTYRLVWVSFIFQPFFPSESVIGFGRPWIAVSTRLTSCFLHWRTVTKEKSPSMTSTVQPVVSWLPGPAITLRVDNQISSLPG